MFKDIDGTGKTENARTRGTCDDAATDSIQSYPTDQIELPRHSGSRLSLNEHQTLPERVVKDSRYGWQLNLTNFRIVR